ncbi:hypothetical protein [Microbacterium soli]|uniref:Tail terminator n=1 Tax=Microbacterium soli TaxID=446075 RepID=A0ABP7NIE8_9MICO
MAAGDPIVAYDDLELFLCSWYRSRILTRPEPVCTGVQVDRVEFEPLPEKLIVIRDDGGPETSVLTGERSVGVSVLAGTRENPYPAKELARIAYALRSQIPSTDPGNPVSAVLDSTAPVMVPEAQERARVYFTLTLAVAGRPL